MNCCSAEGHDRGFGVHGSLQRDLGAGGPDRSAPWRGRRRSRRSPAPCARLPGLCMPAAGQITYCSWRSQASRTRRQYRGGGGCAGRPTHRFGEHGGDRFRAFTLDGGFDRVSAAGRAQRLAAGALATVWVGCRDADDVHQPFAIIRLVVLAGRGAESEQRVAMVPRRQRDEPVLRRLSHLDPVLPGELERRLDGWAMMSSCIEL